MMRFVTSGNFMYRPQPVRDGDKSVTSSLTCESRLTESTRVSPGFWLSEAALWVPHWENFGELTAISTGAVLCVDAEAFAKTLSEHSRALLDVAQYARTFVEGPGRRLTDLPALEDLEQQAPIFGARSLHQLPVPAVSRVLGRAG